MASNNLNRIQPRSDTSGEPEAAQTGELLHHVAGDLEAVFSWHYGARGTFDQLYAKSVGLQWSGNTELDWGLSVDREAFARSFTMGELPIRETRFWRELPSETQWEVARRSSIFTLSNFLHGEQGALMVAAQLVNEVPDLDAKLFLATQTMDEARHVEVFTRYIGLLGRHEPIAPGLQQLLALAIKADGWEFKAVAMQVVVEGLALVSFRDMRNATADPLFRQLLTYVLRDEARHTAFGLKYLAPYVAGCSPSHRRELEDFALECTKLLLESRDGATVRHSFLEIWQSAGIDPNDVFGAIAEEANALGSASERPRRRNAVTGYILPTMRECGLLSDRILEHYEDLFARVRAQVQRPSSKTLNERLRPLPRDIDAWVQELE